MNWLADRLKDLFYSTGNKHLDLPRCMAGFFTGIVAFAVFWNAIHLGKEVDIAGLLTGLAAFATATGAGIAIKEYVRGKMTGGGQ